MSDFEVGEKLRECLIQLVKGKVTEKKKQATDLKSYLSQESYVSYLNRSSLRKKNGLNHGGNVCFTWKIVFSRIKEYIEQECQKCKEREQSSQNLSNIVKTNLIKDKRSCLDLFRCYMKAIHSNQQYDMAPFVMNHILAVLHSSYTRNAFGLEYFLILSRYILSDPLMYINIPDKEIDDAIWFYSKSIKNPPSGWDRGMMTQVFLNLLTARTNLGALEANKILEIFTHSFEVLKSEKASSYHENLLRSMLHVCKSLGVDYRLSLCKLGESVILPLLQLWKTRPSELCCELMLEFISFQLAIHHPKGVVDEEKGARAHDWSVWKSILVNLYKVIVMEIIELCEKNKYSTSKETILKSVFVSVAVQVFAQVLVDSIGVLDVTQFPSTHDGSLPSKKRRIEVCFRTFTDYLQSPKIVPWLQVIAAFILNYPDNISLTDAEHLLDTLMDINLSCNQFETKNWLLNCFTSFVQAFGNKPVIGSSDPLFNWQKLWDLGVKSVALSHQCQDAGHKLLITLLSHKLVTPKAEFYNLYSPGSSNRVTKSSIRTLIVFLEKFQSASPIGNQQKCSSENSLDSFSFENQLIEWLFSRKSDDMSPFQILSSNSDEFDTKEFAHLITLLCLKNISLKQNFESSTIETSQWISDLETMMLQITFDLPAGNEKVEIQEVKQSNLNQSVPNSQLWEKMLKMFIDVSSNIYEEQSCGSQVSDSSILIKHGYLIFDVLQSSCMEGIITEQDLNSNIFISYLKQSLNLAYENEMKKEDPTSKSKAVTLFTGIVDHICKGFERDFERYGGNPKLQQFVIAVSNAISSDILKLVLNFCLENVNIEVASPNPYGPSTSIRKQRKNRYADFDDEDMDIDNQSFEVGDAVNEDLEGMGNLDSSSNENFQEKLHALEVLGKYCRFVTSETFINNGIDVFPEFMKTKLNSLISSKLQCLKGMNDVYLVLMASKCVLSYRHLSESDINCVIGGIKILLNQFNMMQDLCKLVLELVDLILPHLFQPGQSSSTLVQHKSHLLHLLHILSKKELERKGSPDTSFLIAKNIFNILKVEPSLHWPSSSENLGDAVLFTFNKFLPSPFTSARLYVAVNMHLVISSALVESVFISNCSEIFEFLCPMNPVEIDSDMNANRISTFFHYLKCIMLHFPCLVKEALFILCKVIRTAMVSPTLAVKVLFQLSSYLGYESVKQFVELHLKDIFHKWIQAKFNIEEFPFVILEATSMENFLNEYFKTLVPVLFFSEDVPSISKIAHHLCMSESEIIYACFPSIEAQISTQFVVPSQKKNFEKFRTILNSYVPNEVQDKAYLGKLNELVIFLLSMLKKEDKHFHLERCKSIAGHSITFEEFISTICHIGNEKGFSESFVGLLNQRADCIQKIFLSLSVKLSKALTAHDGVSVLYMYQCFLEVISPELKPSLRCSCYIIKEVIYSIINFLITERKYPMKYGHCVIECCNILQALCSKAVLSFKEVIGEFLPFVVSNLIQFVDDSESGKKVLAFLDFLIDDSQEELFEYLPYLDHFPDTEHFRELALKHTSVKYKNGVLSLEQEIKLFLKSCKMIGKATEEGLQHLYKQLNSRKEELLNILNVLKEKMLFSEDVKSSTLHQLICLLSSICASENYPSNVQELAAVCLGAIGPIALSSVVLQPSSDADKRGLNSVQKSLADVFNTLTDYLFDKRIDIKVTASEIMNALFETKIAHTFFTSYKTLSPNSPLEKFASPFYDCQDLNCLRTSCQFSVQLDSIQDLSLWLPESDGHSEWITKLVCTLIESGVTHNNFYECITPLCKKEVLFCEKILPFLIHSILLYEDSQVEKTVSSGIDLFFSHFSSWMLNASQKNAKPSPVLLKFSKASVRTMLDVVHYLWLNPKQESKSCRNIWKDSWLKVSYLEIAQAAQFCSAYFTAVLYTELWCDYMKEKARVTEAVDQSDSSGSLECTPLSFIGSHGRDKASLVYDILLDTYTQIGDFDAISGCEVVAMDSQAILKHSYLTDKKWDGLLKISDMNQSSLEILQALQHSNLNSVLQGYIQSLKNGQEENDSKIREYQCESAWRLGQWNMSVPESSTQGFQELLFKSQQSLVAENGFMFHKFTSAAKQTQFEYLKHNSLETSRNILPLLSHIQMLSVLEDFLKVQSNPLELQDVIKSWNLQDQMPYDDYMFVEPVCWLKCILLKHQVDVNSNKHLHARGTVLSELKKLLEKHAKRARSELHLEIASNAIYILRQLPCQEESDLLCWQVEESKILWTKKEYIIANKILKSAITRMEKYSKENHSFLLHYGQALTLRGRWLAETCNENSGVIMRDYLEKALDVLQKFDPQANNDFDSAVSDAYLAVARYADSQYQSIVNYKKSTAYQTKQDLVNNAREQAKKLQSKNTSDDQRKLLLTLVRQSEIDMVEMKSVEDDRKQFLEKAVKNYLQCLRGSNTHDLWVFRLISLWFQNLDVEEINNFIKDKVHELQTYKFLPLMYQLAARMGTQASSSFTQTLLTLIKNIALQHPHHALPVILALSNADKDPVGTKEVSKQTAFLQQAEVPAVKERMNAAKNMILLLQKSNLFSILKSYSDLCEAYISLAYLRVEKSVKKVSIPKQQAILKIKDLQNIPIITEELKVDRSCEYNNITGIHSFSSEFRMCGGVTLPKVIKCIGTDGVEREQLVKGCDDLRQDAVMQQVFCLVNCLLKQKMETRKRKLHVRTYKVVPVSRRSGVLQWCEGTQVISQYLIGTKGSDGAHERYYPGMASALECRKKMVSISNVSQLPKKRQIFDSICSNFPPVFRYFFLENFPEPCAWFERRQSYTKSVAASSIVGYILGLGDRHVNNILIDKNTAEVVHIDFGIAFEKGRILATPETVPFRLTRDIVDGMGINGVEGIFKRCSEKTLEVMRNSQDVLLTILEVLLHDPLYEWTVPAHKSQKASASSNSQSGKEFNTLAERALMRLQQKLQGLEEGVALSIEGQVNLLIQQARDPNNLCRIYAGWQPYL